jgi:hypothetical protein
MCISFCPNKAISRPRLPTTWMALCASNWHMDLVDPHQGVIPAKSGNSASLRIPKINFTAWSATRAPRVLLDDVARAPLSIVHAEAGECSNIVSASPLDHARMDGCSQNRSESIADRTGRFLGSSKIATLLRLTSFRLGEQSPACDGTRFLYRTIWRQIRRGIEIRRSSIGSVLRPLETARC